MLTIDAPVDSSGRAAWQTRWTAVRLASTVCCHWSAVRSRYGTRAYTTALLTTTSRPSNCCWQRSTRARTSSTLVTSARTNSPPRSLSSRAVMVASSLSRRWQPMTWAPASARVNAMARPMFRPAPVTSARRPSRRIWLVLMGFPSLAGAPVPPGSADVLRGVDPAADGDGLAVLDLHREVREVAHRGGELQALVAGVRLGQEVGHVLRGLHRAQQRLGGELVSRQRVQCRVDVHHGVEPRRGQFVDHDVLRRVAREASEEHLGVATVVARPSVQAGGAVHAVGRRAAAVHHC